MLISHKREMVDVDRMFSFKQEKFAIYWNGYPYIPGCLAGEQSIQHLGVEFEKAGAVPFAKLRGAFSIIIATEQKIIAFADNSYLHTFFVSEQAISDRFLPLTKFVCSTSDLLLSTEAVAQTFAVGRILSGKTIIKSVRMLDKNEYVEIGDSGIRVREKGIPDIDVQVTEFDPDKFFDSLAHALSGLTVSCALTGGYDSRMVYSFLKRRMPIQPSLSGDIPTTSDARVSAKVAEAAGTKLNFVVTSKPQLSEESLIRIFMDQDGAPGFSNDSSLRLYSFYQALNTQGFDIHVTGSGGELHKDWEWIQDFPFYNRKNTNLIRFYDQRLGYNFKATGAGPRIFSYLRGMRASVVSELRQHVRNTNTQSYDVLYYKVNGRRTAYYNNALHGTGIYAPLLERDFVAYSYALPRCQRFYFRNIRSMTTRQDFKVARIPTVYGTTSSSESRYLLRDIIFQLRDYSLRFTRLIGRKVLGRTPLMESVVSWNMDETIRKVPLVFDAIEYCKRAGIVDSSQSVNSLSRQQIGAALQVFLTIRAAGMNEDDVPRFDS